MSPTWIGFLLAVVAIPVLAPVQVSAMPAPWTVRANGEMRVLR